MFKREQSRKLFLGVMCFMMCGALHAGNLTFAVASSSENPVVFDVTTDLKIGPIALKSLPRCTRQIIRALSMRVIHLGLMSLVLIFRH